MIVSVIVFARKRDNSFKTSKEVVSFVRPLLTFSLMGSKTPPQNSAKAKNLGGDQLPIKPIVQLIISGDEETPLIKVSLYICSAEKVGSFSFAALLRK